MITKLYFLCIWYYKDSCDHLLISVAHSKVMFLPELTCEQTCENSVSEQNDDQENFSKISLSILLTAQVLCWL